MTKRNRFQIFDYHNDIDTIDEKFENDEIINWQILIDSGTGKSKVGVEWIEDEPIEIDEDLCLVCMTNRVDGNCGISLNWKNREPRADTFTCMPCWDEIQNNHINIREAVKRRDEKYGNDWEVVSGE